MRSYYRGTEWAPQKVAEISSGVWLRADSSTRSSFTSVAVSKP